MAVCSHSLLRWVGASLAVLLFAGSSPAEAAITDDFGDGNDTSPPWSHFAPTAGATFDASSLSYVISVPPTGNPANPARATSQREDASFADVVVAADLVAFGNTPDHRSGVVARTTSATDDGYAFVVRAPGQIELLEIDNQVVTTLATRSIALSSSVDYRLVFTITGSNPALLTGQLFATSDPTNPIATITHSDSLAPIYTTGFTGLLVADHGALQNQAVSASFDTFFASAPIADTDADGLGDGVELSIGIDPSDADTDGDGLLDGQEIGAGSFGPYHVISGDSLTASVSTAADVDGDGDTDVLTAFTNLDRIAWYENDGTPSVGSWSPHVISTVADGARSVVATDVDGDGDTDALSASFDDDTIAWYENDGTPAVGAWTEHTISVTADGAVSVSAGDVDGDGDMDVVSAANLSSTVAWFENDGSPALGTWPEHAIWISNNRATSAFVVDVDGDGDMDVASDWFLEGPDVAWNENDGTPAVGTWPLHSISTVFTIIHEIYPADVDGDGDTDLLNQAIYYTPGMGYPQTSWLMNDGTGNFYDVLIDSTSFGQDWVFAADIDGDADLDVLGASDNVAVWYENDGTFTWPAHSISSGPNSRHFAADVDGDGDADILRESPLSWSEQQNLADPFDPDTDDDGLIDGAEVNTYGSSPTATDTDGDGLGDGTEVNTHGTNPALADTDGDGLSDSAELFTHGTNPILSDTDGDGLGDGAELNTHGTNPFVPDTDGDGLLDGFEATYGFNPLLPGQQGQDPDADGLTNLQEQTAGSNPTQADTDGDGLSDGVELNTHGTSPTQADTDADGINDGSELSLGTDPLDADTDDDGLLDGLEISVGANPLDADTDDDGLTDGAEVNTHGSSPTLADTDGDGLGDGTEVSAHGTNPVLRDTDGDEMGDGFELANGFDPLDSDENVNSVVDGQEDQDGDGLGNAAEDASDTNPSDPDTDNDGLLDGQEELGSGTGLFGEARVFSTDGASKIVAADVDGDGDMDAISASSSGPLRWYENDGAPIVDQWAAHPISTGANNVLSLAAADLDGDGDQDVLTAEFSAHVRWYENDGTPAVGTWTLRSISTSVSGVRSVFAADLDGDGDKDVLAASEAADRIESFRNNAGSWQLRTISTSADGARAVSAADVDGDGLTDVLSASFDDDTIAWYRNNGTTNWIENPISTTADGANAVLVADLDGDGDKDVLSASLGNDEIAWYQNVGVYAAVWSKVVIATTVDPEIFAADLDGDSDVDLASASSALDAVASHTNDGTPATGAWAAQTISTTAFDVASVFAADMDGDGDNDILIARPNAIAVYLQENAADPLDPDTDDDGLLDGFEVAHGFDPRAAGEQGQDADSDGLTNFAEQTAGTNPTVADSDADGLGDGAELNTYGTNPLESDTDNDGLLDGFEATNGFNPLVAGEQGQDTDADGLTNLEEQSHGTSPILVDSDGDGLGDGAEVDTHGTNPTAIDTDGDGLRDGFEVTYGFNPLVPGQQNQDADGDGLSNLEEQTYGTNPHLMDTDGDTHIDPVDNCFVTYNPDQSNVGSILDQPPDEIGDACQCGDVDDNGIVDFADVDAYRDSLADPTGLPLTPAGVAKCSVIDSAGPCEILDVTVIQRALAPESLLPGIAQVCGAAGGL